MYDSYLRRSQFLVWLSLNQYTEMFFNSSRSLDDDNPSGREKIRRYMHVSFKQ